jgi:hypothetical protein
MLILADFVDIHINNGNVRFAKTGVFLSTGGQR